MPRGHYVTTAAGRIRMWSSGDGPAVLILPGMVLGALPRARRFATGHPGRRVVALEPPGMGGSSPVAGGPEAQADAIADACRTAGIEGATLVAHDLHGPLAARLLALAPDVVARGAWLEAADARAWAASGIAVDGLALHPDGRHLLALFSHLRDRHVLRPDDPTRPRTSGPALPDPKELHETLLSAATDPATYASTWRQLADRVLETGHGRLEEVTAGQLEQFLGREEGGVVLGLPEGLPQPDGDRVRRGYVQTPSGRVHLRRAGTGGRPLLALHSAPGGAGPIEGVVRGLARRRTVVAPDFLGNGDSDHRVADVDIALLAREMLELCEVLGLDEVDLWGTHTGACIALEMSVLAPERVGRVILEAPPLLAAGFTSDILANYLPPLVPDRWGLHLVQAWNMRRDMFLFWPWYRDERTAVRSLGVPPLQLLHDWTMGLLASGETYSLSYAAAFRYATAERLRLASRPVMVTAGPTDMLAEGLDVARSLAPEGSVITETPATVWYPGHSVDEIERTIAIYDEFLTSGSGD